MKAGAQGRKRAIRRQRERWFARVVLAVLVAVACWILSLIPYTPDGDGAATMILGTGQSTALGLVFIIALIFLVIGAVFVFVFGILPWLFEKAFS